MKITRVLVWVVGAALLVGMVGCGGGYAVTANGEYSAEAEIGHKVHVQLSSKAAGWADDDTAMRGIPDWTISPKNGATIKNGMFIATEPGTYSVTAPVPGDSGTLADPVIIVVRGKRIVAEEPDATSAVVTESARKSAALSADTTKKAPARRPTALKVDTSSAKQATASSIELVFASANAKRTSGGGQPATFTLKESRRIRMLESYHFVYGGAAPDAGYFTLETEDGTVLGPFITTRVVDGRTGMENAYWYADVDFILPSGTYIFHDSDPRTWSQNSDTNGVGFCGVSALKK